MPLSTIHQVYCCIKPAVAMAVMIDMAHVLRIHPVFSGGSHGHDIEQEVRP